LRTVLRGLNHEVQHSVDDAAALAQIQWKRPDVVFADFEFGSGQAAALVRHLRKTSGLEDLYVVALCRSLKDDQVVGAYDAGVDNDLHKPVSAALLGARLTAVARRVARDHPPAPASPVDRVCSSTTWSGGPASLQDQFARFLLLKLSLGDATSFLGAPTVGAGIILSNAQDELELRISVGTNEPSGKLLGNHMFGDEGADVGRELLGEMANLAMGALKTAFASEGFAFTGGLPQILARGAFFPFGATSLRHMDFTLTAGGARLLVRIGLGTQGRMVVAPAALQEGMILAKDAFNMRGSLLIRSGTRLSKNMIDLLWQSLPADQQVEVMAQGGGMSDGFRVLALGAGLAARLEQGARAAEPMEILEAKDLPTALRLLDGGGLDAVVGLIGGASGTPPESWTHLRVRHPAVARFGVLSGRRPPTPAHVADLQQILSGQDDPQHWVDRIARACRLKRIVRSEALREALGRLDRLPSAPRAYQELIAVLSRPGADLSAVVAAVEQDSAVATKILQLTNSALFGLGRRIASLQQAVTVLGFDMIKGLALSTHVFGLVEQRPAPWFSLDLHQDYALRCARVARAAAPPELASEAFTAALLMDVGSLVLAVAMPEESEAVHLASLQSGRRPEDVERERLSLTHAEVGALLLGLWGLPSSIVEAVAFHHRPGDLRARGDRTLLEVVHAAEALLGIASCGDPESRLDLAFLSPGSLASLDRWRAIVREELGRRG
jgi:HD-like signal output (HDOD) protein